MPTTFNKKIVLSLQKERSNIIKTYKQMMWDFEQIKQMVNQAKIFSRPGLSGKIHYK